MVKLSLSKLIYCPGKRFCKLSGNPGSTACTLAEIGTDKHPTSVQTHRLLGS